MVGQVHHRVVRLTLHAGDRHQRIAHQISDYMAEGLDRDIATLDRLFNVVDG